MSGHSRSFLCIVVDHLALCFFLQRTFLFPSLRTPHLDTSQFLPSSPPFAMTHHSNSISNRTSSISATFGPGDLITAAQLGTLCFANKFYAIACYFFPFKYWKQWNGKNVERKKKIRAGKYP